MKRCVYEKAQTRFIDFCNRVTHCSGNCRVLFFSMIKDQIFFKSVKQVERVEKLNVTLDQAAKKQIDNYTSQQVSNKEHTNWRDASPTEIREAMDSSRFMDDKKQKYQF